MRAAEVLNMNFLELEDLPRQDPQIRALVREWALIRINGEAQAAAIQAAARA